MKLAKGRHCPVIQMIIVGSKMCKTCDDFGGFDGDICECHYDDGETDEQAQQDEETLAL